MTFFLPSCAFPCLAVLSPRIHWLTVQLSVHYSTLMTTIPTIEPTEFVVGTTVKWTKDLRGEDASWIPPTWTLKYELVITGEHHTITAADNGDGTFLITLAAADTTAWTTGIYKWTSFVSSGSERYQVSEGHIEVLVDFATQTTGYDHRSVAKQHLDALDVMLGNKAGEDMSEYTIADRHLKNYAWSELRQMRDYYAQLYQAELQEERAARGTENESGIVKVRFP